MTEIELYDVFKKLISKSKSIKRYVTAPQYGVELNKNNLGENLKDILGGIKNGPKYPLCILFPPVELPDYDSDWSSFKCTIFFLDRQYNDESGIANRNAFNNLSQKTIEQIWQTMSTAAKDFRRVMISILDENMDKGFRDGQSVDLIERYSDVGNDRLAGVSLTFTVELFTGCEITDYDVETINIFENE